MQFIHFEYSTPTDLSVVTLKSRQKPITWNRTEFRNFDQTCEKTYRANSERFFFSVRSLFVILKSQC